MTCLRVRIGLFPLLLLILVSGPTSGRTASAATEEALSQVAPQLLGAATRSTEAYDRLGELCDNYGHRLSGTPQLEEAIDWAAEVMLGYGFENVHKEEVLVPHWVRGEENAYLSSPRRHRLHILGLGRSVGTPDEGIDAPVLVVESFEDLESRSDADVRDKIVLFNVEYEGYGNTVIYRADGPTAAARKGAVACFVRSVGLDGLQTPHTGALRYSEEDPKIPAAAVSVEDARMMARMAERGDQIIAHLEMQARTLDDAISHNVMGELRGSTHPEEIVVLGGHIDSWDVGQGAQDDGVGCMIALHAVRLIQRLGLHPQRTLRVVLWTNEENGLAGGKAYAEAHADEVFHHVAAIESDVGNGRARGFRLDLREPTGDPDADSSASGREEPLEALRERGLRILDVVGAQLRAAGADSMRVGGSGADISPLAKLGVPCLGLDHDASEYFRIHHTEADTFDRIIAADLGHNVGVMAVMAYALAQMEGELPRRGPGR